MSALARYFYILGKEVGGYDRCSTTLTEILKDQGIEINFSDDITSIPLRFRDQSHRGDTIIIFTPAIPADAIQLKYFLDNGYQVYKRSQVLGEISSQYKTIAIGGSHGKTTISAMVTEIFRRSSLGCSAFLGGISKNFESNLFYTPDSEWAVIEADEFDRSFLSLHPHMALVTSIDSDHLDIYGDRDHLRQSFGAFLDRLDKNGVVVLKEGLNSIIPASKKLEVKYYGLDSGRDYFATNIRQDGLYYHFDLMTPGGLIKDFETAVPGWINIENAVGAAAISVEAGLSEQLIREGIAGFQGIQRRFDVRILGTKVVYIDDYAHHPIEIKLFLKSVKMLFPGKKLTGIFQPHLFSRTQDFAIDFGHELSVLSELILLDIYPAREKPILGVSSQLILDATEIDKKCLISKQDLIPSLGERNLEVVLTMGAGDIDQLVAPIENYLFDYAS